MERLEAMWRQERLWMIEESQFDASASS